MSGVPEIGWRGQVLRRVEYENDEGARDPERAVGNKHGLLGIT